MTVNDKIMGNIDEYRELKNLSEFGINSLQPLTKSEGAVLARAILTLQEIILSSIKKERRRKRRKRSRQKDLFDVMFEMDSKDPPAN